MGSTLPYLQLLSINTTTTPKVRILVKDVDNKVNSDYQKVSNLHRIPENYRDKTWDRLTSSYHCIHKGVSI